MTHKLMHRRSTLPLVFSAGTLLVCTLGCGNKEKKDRDFHTSGNREADQRAEQRIVKDQQLRGESGDVNASKKNVKAPLFERLGGETKMTEIVDDFVTRVLADPRVNWERKGVASGGFVGIHQKSMEWNPNGDNVKTLKKHLTQFLLLATGGPSVYEGKDMKASHAGMKISNAEFDASVGDLKATLDKLSIPTEEQKELLSVVESTRVQVVEQR